MTGQKGKIPMKRRETKEQRAVSFSKRRRGLLNKAAEFCMRARSQVALLVTSPVSKETLYAFGHSSVDAVFDSFMNHRVPDATGNESIVRSGISLFNEIKDMELEKAKGKGENKRDCYESEGFWRVYENLGNCESIGELQVVVDKLEKIMDKTFIRMNDLLSSQLSASGSCSEKILLCNGASASNDTYEQPNDIAVSRNYAKGLAD